MLDYSVYSRMDGGEFRFIGGFESVTGGHTLWIRGENLTIPAALAGAQTYLLPMQEGGGGLAAYDPSVEAPERIRWDRVSSLTGEAKVFVGGKLTLREDRWTFVSTKENPLLVIFYDGPDRSLTLRAIRAGRNRNEYWNAVTPYALAMGAFCELFIAFSFLSRPAFRLTVITSLVALFIPVMPVIGPGILFTGIYKRLWLRARIFRSYRDLVRLPLKYLPRGEGSCTLPDGEKYGVVRLCEFSGEMREKIPLLIPEAEKRKKEDWRLFGVPQELPSGGSSQAGGLLPAAPRDVFATFGAIPGNPETLARHYTAGAYILEIVSWLVLLGGISLNVFFIELIVFLLG
jgi:hypothetical protein